MGKGVTNHDDDDPRPSKFRGQPWMQDMINMNTVNYCNFTGRDVSWRYKFKKADIQSAAEDHWYERLPFTEM